MAKARRISVEEDTGFAMVVVGYTTGTSVIDIGA